MLWGVRLPNLQPKCIQCSFMFWRQSVGAKQKVGLKASGAALTLGRRLRTRAHMNGGRDQ